MSTSSVALRTSETSSAETYRPGSSKLEVFDRFERSEARGTIAKILKDNHETHHCFFNEKGFHNHAAHQILADFSIGAVAEQLKAHYQHQLTHSLAPGYRYADRSKYDPYYLETARAEAGEAADNGAAQRSRIEKIDANNWTRFLGNPRYYWSYLYFFRSQLESDGLGPCLERFVLGDEANRDGRHMLARYCGGVLHGLIHFGYGVEFDLLPTAAEGLAMSTSTGLKHLHLFPPGWEKPSLGVDAASTTKRLVPLMKEMLNDDRLSSQALWLIQNDSGLPDEPFENDGKAIGLINNYADRWSLTAAAATGDGDIDLDAVIADLAWFSVLMVGSVPKLSKHYRHDFFFVHANNAHIFTKMTVSLLAKESQLVYLRGLLRYYIYFWIARGRPAFTVQHWRAESDTARAVGWDKIFEMARADEDEHLPKAVRALYLYSQHIAKLPKGDNESTCALALPGLFRDGEEVPGPHDTFDVFLLTARQLYHQQSGPNRVTWDFNGFYPDVPEDANIGR